jgi:cytochrome c5
MMALILGALLAMHAGAQDRGPQVPLPDGPGKEMVQGTCAQCHGLNVITGSFGYTKEGWEDRLNTMLTLPQDQLNSIDLPGHAFPARPRRRGDAGPVHVTLRNGWRDPRLPP